MNRDKINFLYRWSNYEGQYYIGVHRGTIDDGYIGSGVRFKRMYRKNPEVWTRVILNVFESWKQALDAEEHILKDLVFSDPLCLNLNRGGIGGKVFQTEETKRRLSIVHTGKSLTSEHRSHIGESIKSLGRTKPIALTNKGIVKSAEWRQKISNTLKGRTQSLETRKKKSESHLGLKWWNNGIQEQTCRVCPEGWARGRL